MLRLIIFLFLIFGVIITSDAAEILDNNLIDADKKKDRLVNIKTDSMRFLNDSSIKVVSEYEIELKSLLKKNKLKYETQGKPSNSNQKYLTDFGSSTFIPDTSNDKMDAQTLVDAEMDWMEIKAELRDASAIVNALNRKATNFLEENLYQNINTDFVFSVNIKKLVSSNENINFHEKKQSNVAYNNAEDGSYKTPSSYNDQLTSVDSSYDKNNGEQGKIVSIIYLWNMYSDIIIIVLSIISTLWLFITGLMRFLAWNSKGTY